VNDEHALLRLLKEDPSCDWLRALFPNQFERNDINTVLINATNRITGRIVFGAMREGITTDMFWYFARHAEDMAFCNALLDHGVAVGSALGFTKEQIFPCVLHGKEGAGVNTMRQSFPCRHCLQFLINTLKPLTKTKAKDEGIKGSSLIL
jgi:hypothetical protein